MNESAGSAAQFSPILLSTWSFGQPANRAGWAVLESGGDALDAVEAAARHAEADVSNRTVGIGGLPDRSGRVSVDAAVMLSPARRGSVAFMRDTPHPVSVARRVMEHTRHVLLAGDGAEAFAREQGFAPMDLLTPASRALYAKWLADHQQGSTRHVTANIEESPVGRDGNQNGDQEGRQDTGRDAEAADPSFRTSEANHDTIGVLALDRSGLLAGACTTSGLAWKIPGRVGDSPIIGQGLYVHPHHGAAVCTGHGELVMGVCGSFLAVEQLRAGATPEQAARVVIDRIRESYDLGDNDQVGVIVLSKTGSWSTAALRPGFNVAIKTATADAMTTPVWTLYP